MTQGPNGDKAPHAQPPVNPLPAVVVGLFLVLLGVEAAFSLGEMNLLGGAQAVAWRTMWIERLGFSGVAFDWMLENGRYPTEHLVRMVSYPFLHGSFYHALFAMVILLAMGKIVAETMGVAAFLIIFFAASVTGALAFGLFSDAPWLVGAYPPVYGLIGGFTYLLWLRLGIEGANQYRAFSLIGVLLAIQLLFSVFSGAAVWIADLAGFVTGFVLASVLVPGGWRRLLERLRRG